MSTDEFDEAALAELRDDLGDAFADFVARFRISARSELEAAAADLESANLEGAGARAHALKGTAGYLGAVGLVNRLTRLQDAAAAGYGDEARAAVAEALHALNRLESRISG